MNDKPSLLRREYEGRINRALDHIRLHLSEPLSLEELAKVAAFSPFHFHRLFSAIVGETIHDYIQRQRLERAALALQNNPALSITEVALDCGFSGSAVFARAFKRRFGLSASAFRQSGSKNRQAESKPGQLNGNGGQTQSNPGKDLSEPDSYGAESWTAPLSPAPRRYVMKVEVKEMPALHVAYVRHLGAYGPGIHDAWEKLCRWAGPRGLLGPNTLSLGISYDDPSITPAERCRYDACVTVPESVRPEREVGLADLPGGLYAVARFEGPAEAILQGYQEICGKWFPESGYQPGDSPTYELYRKAPEEEPVGIHIFDICIPVKPL